MSENEFKKLFSPIEIGKQTIPNRIVMTGALPRLDPQKTMHYYAARARGGAGLIVSSTHHPFLTTDEMIPALKSVADAVHQYPTRIFAQILHHGGRLWARMSGGGTSLAPSPVKVRGLFHHGGQNVPRQMTRKEIKRTVDAYAATALRMKKASYDGIEIMAAWSMLQAAFISPLLNIRDDEYGGSLENRMRFLLETIDATRDAIGPDMPLGVRFVGDEFTQQAWWTDKNGHTLEDAREIARRLEATGKLDYLFASADIFGAGHMPPMNYPLGAFTYISAGIKEVVDLPVIAGGRINDPVLAEAILSNNQADLIGMTRALVCDPDLPKKAREGRIEEIRHCIGCNEGCVGPNFLALPMACSLNYEAGREQMGTITPSEDKKTVMIVGGGGAGLEAARVAALRGHRVELYEKRDTLAFELDIAARAPGRQDFAEARRYLVNQIKLLGVDVHLEVTVTPELVIEKQPDVVIIATGAIPYIPKVPGADGKLIETRQVLMEEKEVGEHVLVMDYQNHTYGLDVASFLAEKGKQVELLTEAAYAGSEADALTVEAAHFHALSQEVNITPLSAIKEIQGNNVIIYNVLTDKERTIENIDSVVICTDEQPDDALFHSLEGKVKQLHLIGQALSPRRLLDSIADAYTTASKI